MSVRMRVYDARSKDHRSLAGVPPSRNAGYHRQMGSSWRRDIWHFSRRRKKKSAFGGSPTYDTSVAPR